MAKLYWRLKRNGKWTWKPAEVTFIDKNWNKMTVDILEEEE